MKILDIILLSLSVVCLVIGIHQTIMLGFENAYWIFMTAMILFFVLLLRKK